MRSSTYLLLPHTRNSPRRFLDSPLTSLRCVAGSVPGCFMSLSAIITRFPTTQKSITIPRGSAGAPRKRTLPPLPRTRTLCVASPPGRRRQGADCHGAAWRGWRRAVIGCRCCPRLPLPTAGQRTPHPRGLEVEGLTLDPPGCGNPALCTQGRMEVVYAG